MKLRRIGALAITAGVAVGLAACSATPAETEDQTLLIWDTGLLGTSSSRASPT